MAVHRIARKVGALVAAALLLVLGTSLPASAHETGGLQLTVKHLPHGANLLGVGPGCGYSHEVDFLIETTAGLTIHCWHGQGSTRVLEFDVVNYTTWDTSGGSFTRGDNNGYCSGRTYFGGGNQSGWLPHARVCDLSIY